MTQKATKSIDPLEINFTEKALMIRPKDTLWSSGNLQQTLRTLSISVTLAVGILLVSLFLLPMVGLHEPFMLFFLGIGFISWYLGYRAGLMMTFISGLFIAFFLLRPQYSWIHSWMEFLHLGLFVAVAVVINYLIEKSKHPDYVEKYLKREKEYQELVLKLHKEYLLAKDEIRARDEFLSIASHELKTPLSAMLLQLQTVLHNVRNVSLADFSVENLLKLLDSAEQQSKRLSKMINDLLNVSLITTGRMDLEKEETDLTETVKDCVERIYEKARKDGQQIDVQADKQIKGVFDKLRIEQAVSNLLTNALKYGNGKPIQVEVRRHLGNAEIIITDHGIGIPESLQKKIFVRFERAVAKHSFEGLGVGLYITQQIVEAHGGKVTVESTEGKGSTFTISLPLHK